MALRGKSPQLIEKRLKAFFYGKAGVGKTIASIQFPKPYLIDTEKGAENEEYIELLEKNGGVIFQTSDYDEVLAEVMSLLTVKHDYKTLIIDSFTVIYNDLLDKMEKKHGTDKQKGGFSPHWGIAYKKVEHLINLLMRLDMNVILTSHIKKEYGDNFVVLGQTFDSYKKLDYLFDLALEIQRRGTDRIATVQKTRLKAFPEGDQLIFNYNEIAKRYGRKVLERDAIPEVLATEEQVKELERYVELLKVPQESIDKWLKKSESYSFKEMKTEIIQKCIDALKSKIEGSENEI